MPIDDQRMREKFSFIREQVAAISELVCSSSKESILANPWVVRGLKYALQTAIEAMIDISYHVCAKRFSYPPADARDALVKLRSEKVISEEELPLYVAMVGFRNKLVHGYETISAERVYDVAVNRLGDFDAFIRSLSRLLGEQG